MRRLLWLPVAFTAGIAWGYYSGLVAPLAYGCRLWWSALQPEPCNEADWC